MVTPSAGAVVLVPFPFSDSFVRPGKLFTANRTLMVAEVGSLSRQWFAPIIEALVAVLRSGISPPTRSSRMP